MIGDPLLHVQHTLRPPGRWRYRNPAHDTAATMVRIALWAVFALWLFNWVLADPMPDCVYDEEAASCLDTPAG